MKVPVLDIVLYISIPVLVSACSQDVSFNHDVLPIFRDNCSVCHVDGEGDEKTAFSVSDYESIMKGTKYGPVITPGHSESSTLFRVISHQTNTEIQMPPHHDEAYAEGRGNPLGFDQILTIQNWIDQGARNN